MKPVSPGWGVEISDKTIKPDEEDFDAIENEHGDTKSSADKYRLAQARKMIRDHDAGRKEKA